MPKDFLQGVSCEYDTIVIGSGLAGMTCANTLARAGHRVLLLEQHYKLGGMATWFRRPRGHIFDISLHGFPVGMIKSCRRYWTREIADSIVQLKRLSFDNPMFRLTTTFDRDDFVRLLTHDFRVPMEQVTAFFETVRSMNFYDDQTTTVGQLFERFFPGRKDVVRLLMEPIAYANGSTLEDPAITYGIVFSNFMSKGVYTFQGGTDQLVKLMHEELERNGVDVRIKCNVERILVDSRRRIVGVRVGGRDIKAQTVVSNANLKSTIFRMVGERHFDSQFVEEARGVRLNSSSTQVYIAIRAGEMIDQSCGDLLFSSTSPDFRTDLLLSSNVTSREFSFYYPDIRPGLDRCFIVASTNARYEDWAHLSDEDYELAKRDLVESTFVTLEKYVPNIRELTDHAEAATPRTFEHYTRHANGASFGTKFEGLAISRGLPQQIAGLYHAGSVGIIMSGWLGAMNYGVIVANDVDTLLTKSAGSQLAVAAE